MNSEDKMELIEKNKEKLVQWPLLQCSHEEQVLWFKETVVGNLAQIVLSGDRVEELIVIDELFDVASEAMEDAPLPVTFPDQPGVTREQVEADFKEYCTTITVRSATIEQLSVATPDAMPPDAQFIRPITSGMKVKGYIEHWDAAIGFTQSLNQTGCPLGYTFEEKKIIFGIVHAMNCVAAAQAKQLQSAPSGSRLFNVD